MSTNISNDFSHLSLKEMAIGLRNRTFSSQELTQSFIERIKKYNSTLNSFITICEDQALTEAKRADELFSKEQAPSLMTGIPYAHKDNFCTKDILTTCGSKMLFNFNPPYNATVTKKLYNMGAVLLGKTNMDEFAMGSSNENSYYGPVKNPWNIECVPGGSSGGASATVAARLAPCATGTDTGGSIRQPAAFTNVSGLKPTYGLVSRYGMIAFASSLDQGGPLARSAEDLAIMLSGMVGFDPKDSTSVDVSPTDYSKTLNQSIQGLKIGVPKEYFTKELDPSLMDLIEKALNIYESLGATRVEISLPHTHHAIPVYYVVAPAEASCNLSRYDGVRYGYRCENPQNLEDLYKRTRAEGFGREVKRRIMMGTYMLSAGHYDAYYVKAQKIRHLVTKEFLEAFKEVDVILSPTTPTTAFKIGEKAADPMSMYLSDIFTVPVNLAGLPAMSIPAGFLKGLPVGLQLIGKHFSEAQLLNIAHQYQCVTDWHLHRPEHF